MTLKQPEKEWGWFGKLALAVSCCICAAGFIALSEGSYGGESNYIAPPTALLGGFILAIVLLGSLWLGIRGKQSQSWAFLAYGSWMTILGLMFFHILWYSRNEMPTYWHLYLIEGVIIAFLSLEGTKDALRGQWSKVGVWWLLSGAFILILLPQWIYSPRFAQR